MNLVKWFRKNNMKMMAVVIIIIMLGFVAGPLLQRLSRGRASPNKTVAYYADNSEITNYDLSLAQRELEILQMLRANDVLRSQDLRGIMLGELLFSEQRAIPALVNDMKQLIRQNEYRVSTEQINAIYNREMMPNVYWLLLRNEAQLAGIKVPNENMGTLLGQVMPRLFGQPYSKVMRAIISRNRVSEEEILATFGNLLGVLQYAHSVCSSEDVTTRQIMHTLGWENETIDVEFVKFDSSVFSEISDGNDPNDKSGPPANKEQLIEHFDKYKNFFPGEVSGEENPYGFGYKLPDRARLEYIAIKVEDLKPIVAPPTQQETEEYYETNRQRQFTYQIPSDPNDPNSPPIERVRSYAEVLSAISNQLRRDKLHSTASKIMAEAKTLSEEKLEKSDTEFEKLTGEQLKELAGDYKAAAKKLREKYKINVNEGQTGLLSAVDIQVNLNLGTFSVSGSGQNPVRLAQLVFALDEFGASELETFNVRKYRLYENIGPGKDFLGQAFMLLRVIQVEKAAEPKSIEQVFSISTLKLDPNQTESDEDVYSVKEKVEEDFKRLTAMDTAKNKAAEFLELAAKNGWDNALDKFNETHRRQSNASESDDPNVFKLQNYNSLRRIPNPVLLTLKKQLAGDLTAKYRIYEANTQKIFIDHIYSLVPKDSSSLETPPLIKEFKPDKPMEFKPDLSFYCFKNISVRRLGLEEYEQIKASRFFREEHIQSQSLAAVHFNPENILKRTNFRLLKENEEPADANVPEEAEGES